MKRLAILAAFVAAPAVAAMGFLVGQSTTMVGGQMYTVCSYNVGGSIVNRMIPGPSVCPPSINM
jgi:hypothetical protein